MRASFVTLAVALSVAGGVAGAGWAVESVTLPAPAHADRVKAEALGWFLRNHLVDTTVLAPSEGGLREQCLSGPLRALRHDGLAHASLLVRSGAPALTDALGRLPLGATARRGGGYGLGLARMELAGCPAVIAAQLALVVRTKSASVTPSRSGGKPVLAIQAAPPPSLVTVYVRTRTFEPVAITVLRPGFAGRSRIVLRPPAPLEVDSILRRAGL